MNLDALELKQLIRLYVVDMVHVFHQMSAHAITTHIQDQIALFMFAMEETLPTLKCVQERDHARMELVFVLQTSLDIIVNIRCAMVATQQTLQYAPDMELV